MSNLSLPKLNRLPRCLLLMQTQVSRKHCIRQRTEATWNNGDEGITSCRLRSFAGCPCLLSERSDLHTTSNFDPAGYSRRSFEGKRFAATADRCTPDTAKFHSCDP